MSNVSCAVPAAYGAAAGAACNQLLHVFPSHLTIFQADVFAEQAARIDAKFDKFLS